MERFLWFSPLSVPLCALLCLWGYRVSFLGPWLVEAVVRRGIVSEAYEVSFCGHFFWNWGNSIPVYDRGLGGILGALRAFFLFRLFDSYTEVIYGDEVEGF